MSSSAMAGATPRALPSSARPRRPATARIRAVVLAAVAGAALGAGGLTALADPPKGGYPPDPPAIASRKQWSIRVSAKSGKVTVDRATARTLAQPAETPRIFGRFALELYIGRELLDRIRFDMPLMGDEGSSKGRSGLPRPNFGEGVTVPQTVRIADNPRAAYLQLVDRKTGTTQRYAWPPEADGRVLPWKSGISEAPGDFPEGGVRVIGDAGAPRPAPDGGANGADAGRDGG
jgi:hypothetical protein